MFSEITNFLSRTFFSSDKKDAEYKSQYRVACALLTYTVLGYQDSEFQRSPKTPNEHRLTYDDLFEFFQNGTINGVYYINPDPEDLLKLHKIRNNVFDYMMMLQVFLILSDPRYADFYLELMDNLSKADLTPLEASVVRSIKENDENDILSALDKFLDVGTDFQLLKHHYMPVLEDYFGDNDDDSDDGEDNDSDEDDCNGNCDTCDCQKDSSAAATLAPEKSTTTETVATPEKTTLEKVSEETNVNQSLPSVHLVSDTDISDGVFDRVLSKLFPNNKTN